MRSYENLASEWDRGVWHVSIKFNWHFEWNTPGSLGRYARIFYGLLSKHHRYHSLCIFRSRIRNQIENQIETRKKPNGPNRKSKRKKKKKSTYLVPRVVFRLGLIDVVQSLLKLRTYLLTKTTLPRVFNFICFIRYFGPRESASSKLCTNIDQPYLIWAAVLCYVSILHQKTNDTGMKTPTEKKAWLRVHDDFWRLGVAPKMKSGRPIIYFLN